MHDDDLMQRLALSAYDVALQRHSWNSFLTDFERAFDATKTTLLSQDVHAHRAMVLGSTGFEAEAQQSYESYYRLRNVFLQHGRRLMIPGVVRTNSMMCPDDILLKSEYYNDFMQPNETRYTLGTTVDRAEDNAVHLTVWRARSAGPYEEPDCRALAFLAPHLQRAVQLLERLALGEQRSHGLEAALQHSPRGVAMIDGRGRAAFVNASLGNMIASDDGLRIVRGEIVALHRTSQRVLAGFIADALCGGPGGTVPLRRTSGAAAYAALVAPLSAVPHAGTTSRLSALLVVSDPLAPVHLDVKLLQSSYEMTPAEAVVASRLANGLTIDATARALHMSVSTARTHLKRIFQKTGVSRQAELVRLIVLGSVR